MRYIWQLMVINRNILILLSLGLVFSPSVVASSNESARPSNHWLLDLEDADERFGRIEDQFSGFSRAMWEVGHRFERTYDALVDGNLALAGYHWEKIGDSIRLGYLRRPGRRDNSDAMFLDGPWRGALEALQDDDLDDARRAFLAARGACMACHQAERVDFMNDQWLFRRTESF
jgi:hypothetical protein